jgi:hypothetical protein
MMTIEQAQAFNAGVRATLAIATATADAIKQLPDYREGRQGFARAALEAFSEAGAALLLSDPAGAQDGSEEGASP